MPTHSLIVISDLHLADGHPALEGFHHSQQKALEGILHAALPGGLLGNASTTTLIVNGDCFDFLAVPPYLADGLSTPQIALEKLARIASTHPDFFMALRDFLAQGGKVVFLPGNHDIELCFEEIRTEVTRLLGGDVGLTFGLDQGYQPWPDVYIEHGNQYDLWNYAPGVWDEHGKALTPRPSSLLLPRGTQYMHRAALPVTMRYPYFDHFDPPLGIIRQIALLSLVDPDLLRSSATRTVDMMSYPYQGQQDLAPDEEQACQIFAKIVPDFIAFQEDMLANNPAVYTAFDHIYTPDEQEQSQSDLLSEFFMLFHTLEASPEAALNAIFQPISTPVDDSTTRGMHNVLREHPALRIAVAGHTHTLRHDHLEPSQQVYVNTAAWILRYAPPTPADLSPATIEWLHNPAVEPLPLPALSGANFAWIQCADGQPSTAQLCTWEGDLAGTFRIVEL